MESEAGSEEPNVDVLLSIDTNINMVNFGCGNANWLTDIKPMLKPIYALDSILLYVFIYCQEGDKEYEELIDLFDFENIHTEELLCNLDLSKLPYNCIEYMFKNHYDVFGLIEAGLAVKIKP